VLFGGWYVGSLVGLSSYPTIVIAGLASLFGGTILALPFLFDLLRLPADLFQVFLTVDVIGSRFGTLLAAMHLIGIALIGTYALQGAVALRLVPLLRFALITLVLLAGTLFAIRALYTYVYVAPYRTADLLLGLSLTNEPQHHTVVEGPPPDGATGADASDSLEQILERGTLKVCYAPDDYPSAYQNTAGELVGFDIAVAHALARDMNVSIEFLPIVSTADILGRVTTGYCDVALSLIPISADLTREVAFTQSVLDVPVALIVADHRRAQFDAWPKIAARDELRIAVSDSVAEGRFVAAALPNASIDVYRSKAELDALLAEGATAVDAILAAGEEGAAWTVRYPSFNLVVPTPVRLAHFGYAVDRRDQDLRLYLDTWLASRRIDGTIDDLYRYWMLGEVGDTQPPRWSVLRDVLGWVD
jgi:ABC-type amino acid transport substrate-binding protein